MTDQLPNNRFTTTDSMIGLLVHDNSINKAVALFPGPDREANAALFVNADELVEAANMLEANLMDNDVLKLSTPSHVALRKLRDIVKKIKGEK